MEYAISIYKPGERVYPEQCDFNSYSDLGLICPICKQEVYLRKGNIREPYFAHFHATSSRQVEECELRVSADGNSTEISSLIENRGQRLKIFQQHFISMIYFENSKIIEDVKFNNWINSIKRDNNQAINNIIKDCSQYFQCFLTHQRLMEDKYIFPSNKIKDKQIMLQQKIALEAIDYLCVKSNYKLLEYIIYYCIYQLYKEKFTKTNIDSICHLVIETIMLNPWIKALNNSKNISSLTINISQLFEPEIVNTKSPSPLQIFLAAIQDGTKGKSNKNINSLTINASQLSGSERTKLRTPLTLSHSFNAMQYGKVDAATKVKTEKPVSIVVKVVCETNTDDSTAIQFRFMVNEFIKCDNQYGIKNLDGKPVKSLVEIWHNARIYKFSKLFELSVINYTDNLFPSDGYLVHYPDYHTRYDVARLFETMISNSQFEFVKTLEHNGKLVITSAYDPSVFLLLELLEFCNPVTESTVTKIESGFKIEATKFSSLSEEQVLDCFVNAATKASKEIPLIDGMLLSTLKQFASEQKKQLAASKKTITTDAK